MKPPKPPHPPLSASEIGPHPQLAQVWTPPWMVDLLWRWLARVGLDLTNKPLVADLAAGNGRLIEPVAAYARLILNDIDPQLAAELRLKFPQAQVFAADFRTLPAMGTCDVVVGSPPWIWADGQYLPQRYVEKAAEMVRPGGLIALVYPMLPTPITAGLTLMSSVQPDEAMLKQWPFEEKPLLYIFQRKPRPFRPFVRPRS